MKEKQAELVSIISVDTRDSDQSERPIWHVPSGKCGYIEIRNDYWSATFGVCQEELSQITTQLILIVDFSRICWIDPLPLLSIFIAIKTCCVRTESSLMLLLGGEPTSDDIMVRGGFLKFVSQHGFLSTLRGVPTEIMLGETSYSPEMEVLHEKLSSSMYIMAYPDSLCLDAMIEPVSGFQREDDVSAITSNWINNVRESRIKGFFEGEPDLLSDLFDKMHILLVEIILNAGEHAYDAKEELSNRYVGIYARLRERDGQETKSWLKKNNYISDEKKCCPGFKGFDLSSKHSTWLEIFFVDQGRGLLADIELWKKKSTKKLRSKLSKILSNIKPTTNKLHEIGKLLFQEPLSRHDRGERTVLTGLQYVRHALSDKEDCTAVYTAGEWLGARLPWSPDTMGKPLNLGKQKDYIAQDNGVHFSAGTAWHFCLDLDHVLSEENDQQMAGWDQITSSDVDTGKQGKTQYGDWKVFDDRDLGGGVKSRPWRDVEFLTTPSLWLPALVRKNLVYQWYSAILGNKQQQHDKAWVWIIADLSRKDASLLEAVLDSAEHRGRRNNVQLYMVTRDWCIKCFRTITSKVSGRVFEKDEEQTRLVKENRGTFIFDMLREHDSKIFWEGLPGAGAGRFDSAFISEEIIWERDASNRPSIVLNGYLDLTQALLEPKRLAVARRALERIWYLHANKAECVAADPLLTNLLPREARLSLNESQESNTEQANQQVVVSSVYVTGNTTERTKKAGQSAIHLLRHTQVKGLLDVPPVSSRCALNWLQGSAEIIERPETSLQYERIPGTPYISRGGSKAAPIRRFGFNKDQDFFTNSFYGKNPQETYNELLRFGLLKLGHWVYGAHHDLLTLNLGDCVETKRFYKDTAIEWLFKQLEELEKQASDEQSNIIVVYSSHAVTEKMVTAVKSLASERDAQLPIFIPVHFLAPHAQTAIRIPSLTYDRIRHELRDDQETKTRKKVVLMDDGALTGKVQREMEELLRNAGAEDVIHVGLVTRTGLPLYRKYLSGSYSNTHRYYWRWDVPPLGNARTCPLCRAIDQARELARRMWSKDAAKEVDEWGRNWEASSVTTHWRRHGLNPGHLPDNRTVTFGKEWLAGKEPIKYRLNHVTSTGLAATVMEIIRTTSYKDVGLKLARDPWGDDYQGDRTKWRDAKLEILICQLLLYFDDFTDQEVQERFRLLLEVMLDPESGNSNPARRRQLERLGCLSLLLATERQVKYITRQLWKLFKNSQEPGGHLLSIVGILMRRAGNFHEQLNEIPSKELDIATGVKIKALLSTAHFYGQGEEVRGTRHALFSLVLLLGENDSRNHTGFLRKKLIGELHTNKQDLSRDLRTLEQSLREIDTHVLIDTTASSFNPQKEADKMREYIDHMEKENGDLDIFEEVRSSIVDTLSSLTSSFQENFIITADQLRDFLATSIVSEKWKSKALKNLDRNPERWMKDGSAVLPGIDVSMKGVNNPGEIFVIFPPIARRMVRDYLYNVVHSSRRINDNDLNYDLSCSLDIKEDILLITMWNYTDQTGFPQKKAAEGVVSAQLIKDPANHDLSDGKMTIKVQLPLVEHLYRSEK